MNNTYPCFLCKEYKTSEHFSRCSARKTGLQSKCKKCANKESNRSNPLIRGIKAKLRKRVRDTVKGIRASNSDIGCSGEELKAHLESQFKPGMTWDNYGFGSGKWVIDHIRPISNF